MATDAIEVTYSPSDENFPNPERGFYRARNPFFLNTRRNPLNAAALRALRAEGVSVIRTYNVIDEFREVPLTSAFLEGLAADFAAVRLAGLKVIPRFAYSFPCAGSTEPCDASDYGTTDAPVLQVLAHLDQLAPILRANSDVIAFLETGFIGPWGEWHHSSSGLLNADGTANQNSLAILERVLRALPESRMTTLRYPRHKQQMFGVDPLTPAEAFSGIPKSRIGAHNDCFLANSTDGGTYRFPQGAPQPELFKEYLSADNRYVPQSGETCSSGPAAQPFIGCANALIDLARMRWSTINADYQPAVIELWKTQGCYGEIAKRLGYRFRLVNAEVPLAAVAGGVLRLRLSIANEGWAAPYNPRPVELVLRHSSTGRAVAMAVSADPRLWGPGETHVVTLEAAVPAGLDPGPHDLLLNLPDPEPALHPRADYSIRFANAGVWEASTGYNSLLTSVTITAPQGPGNVLLEPPAVISSVVTLRWHAADPEGVLDYVLEAGSAPGASDLYNGSVGTSTVVTATVPAGTYFVRVRARGVTGLGPASNEVSFTIAGACQSPPARPVNVSGAVAGGMATVSWSAVPGAESYRVEAGSASGLADVFSGNVGGRLLISSPVASGFRAYVRVHAVNGCGQSHPSAEILVR